MPWNKSWPEWVAEYSVSHRHPFNRFCHTVGIPMIVLSLFIFGAAVWMPGWWKPALALFAAGWLFQFAGHAVEGKRPEFFRDWRFLFVGLRWWWAKVRGRA
jgi:uncharacterized membrane protein YGL010W